MKMPWSTLVLSPLSSPVRRRSLGPCPGGGRSGCTVPFPGPRPWDVSGVGGVLSVAPPAHSSLPPQPRADGHPARHGRERRDGSSGLTRFPSSPGLKA